VELKAWRLSLFLEGERQGSFVASGNLRPAPGSISCTDPTIPTCKYPSVRCVSTSSSLSAGTASFSSSAGAETSGPGLPDDSPASGIRESLGASVEASSPVSVPDSGAVNPDLASTSGSCRKAVCSVVSPSSVAGLRVWFGISDAAGSLRGVLGRGVAVARGSIGVAKASSAATWTPADSSF
jgi:hypothetical protein